MLEPVRLVGSGLQLWRAPAGRGLVVDLPGFGAPEVSLAPLRQFLRWKGYDACSWGLGVNRGNPERLTPQFLEKLQAMVQASGGPASLVGWSLGGVIAREAARMRPDLVARVIAFGSPFIGGPSHTLGAPQIGQAECDRIAALQRSRDEADPVQTPVVTIFSRRDGVVDWRASMDRFSPRVQHVEVHSAHGGLPLDPDVWLEITGALAD